MKSFTVILIAIFALCFTTESLFAGPDSTKKTPIDSVKLVKATKNVKLIKTANKPATLNANPKRFMPKSELDTVKTGLDTLADDEQVTMGLMRDAMALIHDITLRDGHAEYLSLDGMFKDQMTVRYAAKLHALDSLNKALVAKNAAADTVAKELQKKLDTLEWFYNHLSKQMDGIGTAVLVTAKATNAVVVKAAEEWEFTPEQKGYFQGLNKYLEDVAKNQK